MNDLQRENAELRRVLADAVLVIEDFMPNIARCVLQDYGRLNDVLIDSHRLLKRPVESQT